MILKDQKYQYVTFVLSTRNTHIKYSTSILNIKDQTNIDININKPRQVPPRCASNKVIRANRGGSPN